MCTETPVVVVSHERGLLPGTWSLSRVTKGLMAALAVVLVSFGPSAYAGDGPYVGIGAGLSILNDSAVTAPANEPYPPLNINATTDNGFAVRGMAGYAFPSGLRVEAEIDYRRHKTNEMDVKNPGGLVKLALDSANIPPEVYAALPADHPQRQALEGAVTGPQPVKGAFSMLAFMANVDYDFDTGSPWIPYVGGGLGVATISLDTESASGTSLADDSDTVFAYQVGAGIGYEFPLEEGRSITVSLDWRYFGTQDPTFTGDVTGAEFDVGISGHDIGIGLIYGF